LKKAFCQPGNVDFCPVVSVVAAFTFSPIGPGTFTIPRPLENGGDVTYTGGDDILKDFASEALHPGDLKNAATPLVISVLDRLSSAIKQDSDASKSAKTLKALQKKMAKAKK
jgi:tyrosyl-tRNA synthetase